MKRFLSKLALFLLCLIGLAGIAGGASLCIMAGVHKHSVKDEFFNWFPALEKKVETKETSKDDDIVIEDETSDETQTEEGTETSGETTDEGTSTEGTEQTEETQS